MSNCTPSDINYFLLACLSSRFSWIRLSPQNNQMRLNHHTQETHFFQFMFMIWECFTIFIVLLLGLLIMVILIYISCLSRYQIYYECLFTNNITGWPTHDFINSTSVNCIFKRIYSITISKIPFITLLSQSHWRLF